MESILKEQWLLSKHGNISPEESDNLPDFERAVYINFLLSDQKKEQEQWSNSKKT